MPLKHFASTSVIKPDKLYLAPILIKLRKQIVAKKGISTYEAIEKRLVKAVQKIDESASNGYTIFGMILGDQAWISKADHEFIWNRMYEVFGPKKVSFDFNKKSLGTLLMWAFSIDNRNWLFDMDPEKEKKLLNGEIPDATQYFLDSTGKSYQLVKKIEGFTLEDLVAKFNSRTVKN